MVDSYNTSTGAPLPAQVAAMQTKIEDLYLKQLALERDLNHLRTLLPIVVTRPGTGGLTQRAIRRLSPRARRKYQLSLLRNCGLFDAAWYLRRYPDVAKKGMDPAEHFLFHGAADLRNPGPYFDTQHYLQLYPDIADNGMNPLVHYVVSGIDEGRSIRPGMPHIGV